MAKKSKSKSGGGGGFKDLLLKKGEKIGLIAAIAGFVIFLLVGVSSFTGAVNPIKNKQLVDLAAQNVQEGVVNDKSRATPLPPELQQGKPDTFAHVPAETFPIRVPPFELSTMPSTLRDNPLVLSPIESQVNYFAGSYKGYDRIFERDANGDVIGVRAGVIKVQSKGDISWGGTGAMEDKFRRPPPKFGPGSKTPPGVRVPPPMPPAPVGGGEGAAPAPAAGGKPSTVGGEREDVMVQHMPFDEAAKSKFPPARTIYPARMAVVQLTFPLKDQLMEIMRSLRLPNLAAAKVESSQATIDARAPAKPGVVGGVAVPPPAPVAVPPVGGVAGAASIELGDAPAFTALVVERRTTGPDGQPSGWEAFDHQEKFREKFTWYDAPFIQEDGYWPYFLRPYQNVSSPLPVLTGGAALSYPPNVTLPSIVANFQRLVAAAAPKKAASELETKFKKGDGNPYATTPNAAPAGQPGVPAGGDDNRAPIIGLAPGMKPAPMVGEVPGAVADPNRLDVEYILMRFVDAALEPGNTYEYRVKIRMKNPNFNNAGKVANDSMAAEETLESAWYEVPQKTTVPTEKFLYAYSVKKYEDHVKKLYDETGKADIVNRVLELKDVQDGRKAVVQEQRWQEYLTLGATKQEPIGAWIQAVMAVGPGEFIGRRTLVELPLWRSGVMDPKATKDTLDPYTGAYVLPSPDAKSPMLSPWPADSPTKKYSLPRARILDFRTPHVLVDFDGGRVNTKAGTNTHTDDVAAELLILRDDGKIETRREAVDMPNAARAQREKTWEDWVAMVRKSNEVETPGTKGPNDTFVPRPVK